MHWFNTNTADELAHEDYFLRALAKGGFDQVLQGIGAMYGLDTLHVVSVGFLAVPIANVDLCTLIGGMWMAEHSIFYLGFIVQSFT
mmetsp:Transcript_11156/g.16738  ORF Transcript_11156/g.16738 Transcript_11156/m.16738 type:complete len:86 (+) Transcript_11156:278-535(+)